MRGASGPGKVERTPDGNHGELNAQMDGWSYGRFDVPTALIKSPEEKYRVCAAKQEKVDALLKSILQFGPSTSTCRSCCSLVRTRLCPRRLGSSCL